MILENFEENEKRFLRNKANKLKNLCKSVINDIEENEDDLYRFFSNWEPNNLINAYRLQSEISEVETISNMLDKYMMLECSYNDMKYQNEELNNKMKNLKTKGDV